MKDRFERIYIELTTRCNLNCKICYRRSWKEKEQDLEFSLLAKIFEEIKDKPIKEVVLGGIGEPLIYSYIYEAINLFSNFNLTITTNGTLLQDKKLAQLILDKVTKLVVSIDGSFETFEKIRNFPLTQILETLKYINNLKNKETPLICVEFVLFEDNKEEIYKVLDLLSPLNIHQFMISQFLPQTEDNRDKILYKLYGNTQLKKFFDDVWRYAFKKGVKIIFPKVELKTERFCSFMETKALVIGSDGLVYPCYRFSHNFTEYIFGRKKEVLKYPFGDLRVQSLEEIYLKPNFIDFRTRIMCNRYPSCLDCDLVEGCALVKTSECDCYALSPSCGDCLWSRGFVLCP